MEDFSLSTRTLQHDVERHVVETQEEAHRNSSQQPKALDHVKETWLHLTLPTDEPISSEEMNPRTTYQEKPQTSTHHPTNPHPTDQHSPLRLSPNPSAHAHQNQQSPNKAAPRTAPAPPTQPKTNPSKKLPRGTETPHHQTKHPPNNPNPQNQSPNSPQAPKKKGQRFSKITPHAPVPGVFRRRGIRVGTI